MFYLVIDLALIFHHCISSSSRVRSSLRPLRVRVILLVLNVHGFIGRCVRDPSSQRPEQFHRERQPLHRSRRLRCRSPEFRRRHTSPPRRPDPRPGGPSRDRICSRRDGRCCRFVRIITWMAVFVHVLTDLISIRLTNKAGQTPNAVSRIYFPNDTEVISLTTPPARQVSAILDADDIASGELAELFVAFCRRVC